MAWQTKLQTSIRHLTTLRYAVYGKIIIYIIIHELDQLDQQIQHIINIMAISNTQFAEIAKIVVIVDIDIAE